MTDVTLIDTDSTISKLASEARLALSDGQTSQAAEKYLQAAKRLKASSEAAINSKTKHFCRFLAASHFYYGGHYDKAFRLARRVEARLLEVEVRSLFEPFLRAVEYRSNPKYAEEIRSQIDALRRAAKPAEVIEMLKSHPYVLQEADVAFIRAIMCEQLGHYKAAALFYAFAFRLKPNELKRIYTATVFPFGLSVHQKLSEAWEFARVLAASFPHPVTMVIASTVCYHLANSEVSSAELWTKRQLEYFVEMKRFFTDSSRELREDRDMLDLFLFCHEAAAFGYWRLGLKDDALLAAQMAVEMSPQTPGPRVVRGILTFPSLEANRDLELAISFGDFSHLPHVRLAYDAIGKNDPIRLLEHSRRALQFELEPKARSVLLVWLAIAEDALGRSRLEVDSLFRQALALNPSDDVLNNIYRDFLADTIDSKRSLSARYNSVTFPKELEIFVDCVELDQSKLRNKFSAMTV